MRKIRALIGTLVTVAMIVYGINKLGFIVRPTDTDGAYSQIETFHSLPEDSVEVIIYGSSHAYRGLSTIEMYNKYGIGAYNYAWHWQSISTTKIWLKDSLLTQSPKVALIECFNANAPLKDVPLYPEIYYCRYLRRRSGIDDYLKQCFGTDKEKYLAFYMPLCAFHDNWDTLTESSFAGLDADGSFLRKTMGYAPDDKVTEITIPEYLALPQEPLSTLAIAELDEIVSICQENDVEIVFYTVRWEGEYKNGDAMAKYAQENGCAYLDLFKYADDVGYDGATDFSDKAHLNTSGSIKTADYIGKYLLENYDLKDMRDDEGDIWGGEG